MNDRNGFHEKRIRIPVVASCAYKLLGHVVPPPDHLPLDVRTDYIGTGADKSGRRFQVNKARLHWPGLTVIALVRSWEDVEGTKRFRKTLEFLEIEYQRFSSLDAIDEYKQNHPILWEKAERTRLTPVITRDESKRPVTWGVKFTFDLPRLEALAIETFLP